MKREKRAALGGTTARCKGTRTPATVPAKLRQKLDLSVDALGLNDRARNVLKGMNILFVGQLVQKTERMLLKREHCGPITVWHIGAQLEVRGLTLSMKVGDWSPPTTR